ncbi:MAG: RecQ family ATP-dependent DNA helicase [Ignavibacteriae bacterium]|nr:RecQ family ATP-dependent DNA helicase [Ignavibacteriota bacterium]NOG99387.1 RecQ family ATP-dependent DNA helicase [Ignavibacteriota bacterium]
MNRQEAEIRLKNTFGFDHFYDEQWETIDLLFQGKRVLLIEKTGFGKSLCFQFPATQFQGLTVIFSPLIALMRDQVKGLNEKGIKAKYINSEQTPEENSQTIQDALNGRLKILYIAPERQENQEWIEATRRMNLSMIVIDEAHTISVWGHDFRPAFRRIINLVKLLPENLPVLATTATATKRVQEDIERQISGNIQTIRGELIRENFRLYVIKVQSEDEKLLWLAENLPKLEGNGLIYTGTRVNTEIYSRWFEYLGIGTTEYNAGLDSDSRKEIENGLMNNEWKAVVSTNALGMGIDKSDIRFIIHTQIPASPIHYYQEIGRAGRDGKPTKLILFYNSTKDENGIEEDFKLPKAFIDGGRPSIKNYNKVINVLKQEQLGERQIMKATNLKQTQVRVIKADLIEQGIVKEVIYGRSKKYEYQFNAPELNTKAFDELREQKLTELSSMIEYVNTGNSRMKFLCDYLGDKSHNHYQNCDNTTLEPFTLNSQQTTIQKLQDFRESYFPELIVESKYSNIVNGVASSYYGVSSVGAALHRSKYENGGDFPDFLLKLTLKAFRKKYGQEKFDFIVYVPPTESGDLVKNFAEKLSQVLKIPISHKLIKTGETQPQKVFKNGYLKKDNVAQKFSYSEPNELVGKSVILFDDIFDSGATIKEIGNVLTKFGVTKIAPLVIARTVGGDI